MKKTLIVLIAAVSFLLSCQKESDSVFDQSSDTRTNVKLREYFDLLVGAPNGWKSVYFPDSTKYGGWAFLIKFKEDGSVTMYSDYDPTSAQTPSESHYKLGSIQKPSLIFDSYCYLHKLADPGIEAKSGKGYGGDFQFEIESVVDGVITLKGHFGKSIMRLVKASSNDVNLAKTITKSDEFSTFLTSPNLAYFKTLTVGSTKVNLDYNAEDRKITFKYEDKGVVVTAVRGVGFIPEGAVLSSPITFPNVTKPLSKLTFTSDGADGLLLNLAEYSLTGSLLSTDIPAIPFLKGIKDLQWVEVINVTSVSPSLQGIFTSIKAIPSYKNLQFYFNAGVNHFNEIDIFTLKGTIKNYYAYNVTWQYGIDGVLTGSYTGTTKGRVYEATVKPFLDKFCASEGCTVMDMAKAPMFGGFLCLVRIVSRKDSRDWISLSVATMKPLDK